MIEDHRDLHSHEMKDLLYGRSMLERSKPLSPSEIKIQTLKRVKCEVEKIGKSYGKPDGDYYTGGWVACYETIDAMLDEMIGEDHD